MPRIRAIPTLLAAALAAAPALAQQTAPAAPPESPTGVVATTNNPNLTVATVKLEAGTRASKIIGEAVQNDQNERVGTVDDLIVSPESKITMAIVSVGGFLGIGSKLVAVPWDQLKAGGDHLVLPGATKDSLNAAPTFQY